MNKAVYKHLLETYGRQPGYWVGFITSALRSLLLRVLTAFLVAQMAASLATGDLTAAKNYTWGSLLPTQLALLLGPLAI